MHEYVIAVEYYAPDNEEGPVSVEGILAHKIDGVILFKNLFPEESTEEDIINSFTGLIKELLSEKPNVIKDHFPKFYSVVSTKQYWYHIFKKGVLPKLETPESGLILPTVSEINELNLELLNDDANVADLTFNTVDVWLDTTLNKIDTIPDRINYFDTI